MLKSLRTVLEGARRAIRDPRLLSRLAVVSAEERDAEYEAEARGLLGDVPRTVAVEQLLDEAGGFLPVFSFLDDTSTVLDLLLLRTLVARSAGKRFFEIGTFRGESAVAVADVATDIVTLSLPDERLSELSLDPSWIAAHRTFSQGMKRVRHLFADSRTADVTDYENWADVLFIDGDHGRNAVESDTRRFWDVRRRETGVVVWHDGFLTPLRPRWEVLAGIAAGLPPELRQGLVHVSNTLCVAWLPESHRLCTVALSYVPRIAFTVSVGLNRGWQNARESQELQMVPRDSVATKTGEPICTAMSVSQHK